MRRWQPFDVHQRHGQDINDWTRIDGSEIQVPIDVRFPGWQQFTTWNDLGSYGEQLRGRKTKHIYIAPDGLRVWNLAGDWEGREGVILRPDTKGFQDVPFEQRYSAGPYLLGEEHERTDYRKRIHHFGVTVGPAVNMRAQVYRTYANTEFGFRMIEDQWWEDWPEHHRDPAGFWGSFTRTHGWRFLRVRRGEPVDDTQNLDPVAYKNLKADHSMTIHSEAPFYSKTPFTKEWRNDDENAAIHGRNHGIIPVVNRGDWDQAPKFIIEGSGIVTIQDAGLERMVEIPKIFPSDGLVLVDTDPNKRTFTASSDPVDTLFYRLIRSSAVFDWILGDLTQADSGLPIGRRMEGGKGFVGVVPARTATQIRVTHSNPRGKITAVIPQQYKRGYA